MKKLTLVLILLVFTQHVDGQIFSKLQIDSCKSEVSILAESLRVNLNSNDEFRSDYQKQLSINFTVDTFKIEQLSVLLMEINYSTAGMSSTVYTIEKEYDILLNKYYMFLAEKLDKDDKIKLKESQQNWLKFRDSERKLNSLLSLSKYSGGGSIQSIFRASKYLSITSKRVIELHYYLTRFYE